jgi:hypothetical protein
MQTMKSEVLQIYSTKQLGTVKTAIKVVGLLHYTVQLLKLILLHSKYYLWSQISLGTNETTQSNSGAHPAFRLQGTSISFLAGTAAET